MSLSFVPSKKTPSNGDKIAAAGLPEEALRALEEHQLADAPVQAQADLAQDGRWGRRVLVASGERLLILAEAEGSAGFQTELELPISSLREIEAKALVGGTSLEARVELPPEYSNQGDSLDGFYLNGAARNGSVNKIQSGERVIELLRSSNAFGKELTNAARKLKQLRDDGAVKEDVEEDAKWQRQTCPNCARALPPDSNVCPFCVNRLQALKRLLSYLGPYKWIAISNGLLSIVGIGLSFVPPIILAYLIDNIFRLSSSENGVAVQIQHGPEDYRLLGTMVLLMVLASFVGAGIHILRGRAAASLGARVIHDIRSQVYTQLQKLSVAYYDKREVGAVMSRVQNDTGMLQNFLLDGAENIILSTLTILGVLIVMFTRSPILALVVLLPVPFVVVGTTRYWRGLMKLWRRVWHQNSALGARLADSLNGVRVVRAFAQEGREVEQFQRRSGELRDATMNVEKKAAIFYPTLGFIMGLGGPLTWYFGGRQVLDGVLTLGGLTLFTVLLQRLYEPIQNLTRLINFTTRAMTAAERVFEILDTTPEVQNKEGASKMPRVEGDVEFRDVTFGYDKHRPVLHGVNLQVKAGEMIGLVGHSGAGKSTLINLLMRFYDVDEGGILVDGVDLRDIDRDDLRSQIGVVLQEPYLFHGSIFDNIAYGKPGATPPEVMAAAKAAFAHDFIVNFPDGYDTVVGERGTRLSGGERQRISIARAILHDPRILILDEATASVDTQTEQQIQKALQNLVRGRTTFAIAHRLSTLRNASRLVVLDGGRIAEEGTHDELIQKRGTFYNLVNAQKAMNEITAIGG